MFIHLFFSVYPRTSIINDFIKFSKRNIVVMSCAHYLSIKLPHLTNTRLNVLATPTSTFRVLGEFRAYSSSGVVDIGKSREYYGITRLSLKIGLEINDLLKR